MRGARVLALAALALVAPGGAAAQFSVHCASGSGQELRDAMRQHGLQSRLMLQKFSHVYYGAGGPEDTAAVRADIGQVQRRLAALAPRRAALLFQARASGGPVCTWLLTKDGITPSVAQVSGEALASLRPRLLRAFRVDELTRGRAPVHRGVGLRPSAALPAASSRQELLAEAARLLLPDPIAGALEAERVDTLVVVATADLATIPWGAIPVGGRPLAERASIVVAPDFEAVLQPALRTPRPFEHAVVVGNPAYPRGGEYELPDLPGALAEAQDVARLVSADALVGRAATAKRVRALVAAPERAPRLIYLATHGLSDPENPLDGGALWLADLRWSAREIRRLPLERGRPLVVLSACQTGLGKTFDVGTIGMSRAWVEAGASRVVMSLWRVDDAATRLLMTRFVALAASLPVDRALQRAMLETRGAFPDEARWASFAVMGMPEPDGAP